MPTHHLRSPTLLIAAAMALAGFAGPAAAQVTEFTIPTANSQPIDAITTGPDGNLWFAEFAGNKTGRITPAGAFTEFPLPTANSRSDAGSIDRDSEEGVEIREHADYSINRVHQETARRPCAELDGR